MKLQAPSSTSDKSRAGLQGNLKSQERCINGRWSCLGFGGWDFAGAWCLVRGASLFAFLRKPPTVKLWAVVAALLTATGPLPAAQVPLFGIPKTWKYSTNDLSAVSWQSAAYNDSAWPSGPALL